VITFDLKAVEIKKAACLDVVCRVGGFHIMKSLLGATETLMGGSVIEELLVQIYGSNTVADTDLDRPLCHCAKAQVPPFDEHRGPSTKKIQIRYV